MWTNCIDVDPGKKLYPYRDSKFMYSIYYFSLPFNALTVEIKNVVVSVIAKVLLCNVFDNPYKNMKKHTAFFRFVDNKTSFMPAETLQYCLENYIEDYKSKPCFGVIRHLNMTEVFETMVKDKMF